jgi:hypothetical protein
MNVVLTFSCHVILNPRQATVRIHGTKNSCVKIDDAKVELIFRNSNRLSKEFGISYSTVKKYTELTTKKTPEEVKSANFDRYINAISNNLSNKLSIQPGENVDSKASYLKLIFLRIFGYNYAGHYILQGLNLSNFDTIYQYLIDGLTNVPETKNLRGCNDVSFTLNT